MQSSLLKKLLAFPWQPPYLKGLHKLYFKSKYQCCVIFLQFPGSKGSMQGSEGSKQRGKNIKGHQKGRGQALSLCIVHSVTIEVTEKAMRGQ